MEGEEKKKIAPTVANCSPVKKYCLCLLSVWSKILCKTKSDLCSTIRIDIDLEVLETLDVE